MANLKDSPIFQKYDDYYTPKSAWENINHIIPKDKIIWEGCMLNSYLSQSPTYLSDLGNNIIYSHDYDILVDSPETEYDMIITNPPFTTDIKIKILKKLVEIDKPFIIIMNSMNLFTKYLRQIFEGKMDQMQIITPSEKIHFDKLVDGELIKTKNCSFYSVYLCYKMNLENKDLWI